MHWVGRGPIYLVNPEVAVACSCLCGHTCKENDVTYRARVPIFLLAGVILVYTAHFIS